MLPRMLTFGMTGDGGFDPLVLLLMALLVEAYIGEARRVFKIVRHPVKIIGDVIAFFERKLNRESRSQADRAIRGALVVVFLCGAAFAIGWGVSWLSLNHAFGWIIEFAGIVMLLSARSLYDHVSDVAKGLRPLTSEASARLVRGQSMLGGGGDWDQEAAQVRLDEILTGDFGSGGSR